jgi:hypothetical protein
MGWRVGTVPHGRGPLGSLTRSMLSRCAAQALSCAAQALS